MRLTFKKGILNGIPICLGYFSVSFGVGITAVQAGLSVLSSVIISATNLTSAGQASGIEIIAAGGTLLEMALTQFIINLRYSLMGISLSQKLSDDFTIPKRIVAAFGITDEIFAVASSQVKKVTASYMYGLIIISWLGWVSGTLLGATAGQILPASLTAALSIMLYGMFIAIIIPDSRKEKSVLFTVVLAAWLSIVIKYLPFKISSGFSVIICAVVVSAIAALIFPIKDEENKE